MVEGEDVNVVALVLLDDVAGIFVGVERIHQDEGHIDIVCAVEIFDLADGQVEERHAVSNLNDGFGTNTTHRCTESTIQLDDREFVQELDGLRVGQIVVVHHLVCLRRLDAIPCENVALGFVIQVSAEEGEKVVHFSLETFLLFRILHGIGKVIESISHLACSNGGRGILKSLERKSFVSTPSSTDTGL